MRHSEYNAYGREIARRNKKIGHSDTETHFARIVLSMDDLGQDNLAEFINSLRNQIKLPFLIWIAYDHQLQDNNSDQYRKVFRGSYVLLEQVKENKYDLEEQAYDQLEEISDEITAFMIADFDQKMNDTTYQPKLRLVVNEANGQKLGRVEGYLAMRFDFAFWRNYNGPLNHNSQNWID